LLGILLQLSYLFCKIGCSVLDFKSMATSCTIGMHKYLVFFVFFASSNMDGMGPLVGMFEQLWGRF